MGRLAGILQSPSHAEGQGIGEWRHRLVLHRGYRVSGHGGPGSEIPNIPAGAPSGSLTYSSSGLKLTGVWATLPISFPQSVNVTGANVAAHATVPVLAVTEANCTGSGVNSGKCQDKIPHMLGVGFGRKKTERTSPAHNPFLNLTEIAAGTMRAVTSLAAGGCRWD